MQGIAEQGGFDAVIVAYRSAAHLETCITGLIDAGAAHVTVVDNSDDSASQALVDKIALSSEVPLRYCGSPTNLGFGGGANLGFRLGGTSDWVAFVSPDVEITQRIAPLLRDAVLHEAAVISGLLRPADPRDGTNARPRFTVPRELLRAVAGSRRSYRTEFIAARETRKVDQLDGCFLVMRRTTFSELDGFDEQFELYFEDVDLCGRVATRGGCWLHPKEYGRHIGGASRDTAPAAAYLVFRISRIRYLRKWTPRFGTVAACSIGALEFLARTALRAPEGDAIRIRSLPLQLGELKRPGSRWILSDRRRPPEGPVRSSR